MAAAPASPQVFDPLESIRPYPLAGQRTVWLAIAAAGFLGLLGDILFRNSELGINLPIWIGAVALLAVAIAASSERGVAGSKWWLVAFGFAFCFAIRSAEYLRAFDFLAMLVALSLPSLAAASDLARARLRDFVANGARTAAWIMGGLLVLLGNDVKWGELPRGRTARTGQVALGLLLAVPVVLVFGGLFASADPVFRDFALALFGGWQIESLVEHLVLMGVCAWLGGGLLRNWLQKPSAPPLVDIVQWPRAGVVPVSMAVGAMLLTFTLFVAIQLRWLFGGAELVEQVAGLSYAEYARSGFFQMVAASCLALPVLYGADAMMAGAEPRAVTRVRTMGRVQLVLMGVVLVSALNRMSLYIGVFGLTEDRLVCLAIIAWLAIVATWFALTVLRGRRERFTWGAVSAGFTILAALNAVNPDALIARVNTARAAEGHPVDAAYLKGLSADAVPVLVERLPMLPADARCEVVTEIRKDNNRAPAWREWNVGQHRAWRAARQLEGC